VPAPPTPAASATATARSIGGSCTAPGAGPRLRPEELSPSDGELAGAGWKASSGTSGDHDDDRGARDLGAQGGAEALASLETASSNRPATEVLGDEEIGGFPEEEDDDDEQAAADCVFPETPSSTTTGGGGAGSTASSFFSCRMRLPPESLDSDAQRQALNLAPLPEGGGSLKATVLRIRGSGLFSQPRWRLYMDGEQPVFLASAARTASNPGSMKPYYVLSSSLHEQRFDRSSPHFLARLAGNMLCTQYELRGRAQSSPQALGGDVGRSPSGGDGAGGLREELMVVRFKKPTDAPRSMEVALPQASRRAGPNQLPASNSMFGGQTRTSSSRSSEQEGGLARAWSRRGSMSTETTYQGGDGRCGGCNGNGITGDDIVHLASPAPVWDAERDVYAMNFHGRARRASAKNFQLAPASQQFRPIDGASLCMQFGRVDEDTFNLDFAHPLSPVQAFGIALSVFDNRPAEKLRLYY